MRALFDIVDRSPRWMRWGAALAWMGVIFRLSAISGANVPGRFATLGHFGVYAILGALLWIAVYRPAAGGSASRGASTALAVAVIVASLYGITDEFHQSFVPGRVPDVVDWGVDTLGALAGAGALTWLERRNVERRVLQQPLQHPRR